MKTAHVISLIAVLVGVTAFPAMRPVAQWDVVPCQRLKEPFKAGVVAFYDKPFYVEFTVNGKKAAKVDKPTLNDRTKVVEHWFTIDPASFDPSKLKVSVEYGLCEMLNKRAIRAESAPKDGDFAFNISDCEAVLPEGTVDSSVERVYKELPKWEESIEGARDRYKNIIKQLADKYPTENLLLVTHGEGVGVSVTAYAPEHLTVYEVEYCAYSRLQRTISRENQSVTAGEFELCLHQGQNGICFMPSTPSTDEVVKEPEPATS